MDTIDFAGIARFLLEKQLNAFPNEKQDQVAYGLQDSYQSRGHTSPRAFGYEYDNFSAKQKDFIYSISDALMDLCKERFCC
jgi:hypothetical protein